MESLHHLFGTWLPPASEMEDDEQVRRDYLYYYLRYHFKDLSRLEPDLEPITLDCKLTMARNRLPHDPAEMIKLSVSDANFTDQFNRENLDYYLVRMCMLITHRSDRTRSSAGGHRIM